MSQFLRIGLVLLGKVVSATLRLAGRGSALPGLLHERVDPHFLRETLDRLPYGVVVISGTNGKTTTTKLVAAMLRGQGLTVFTNPSGSNYSRGVVSALLAEVDWRGRLAADIAVLELDEAQAVPFVAAVPPRFSLLLNVMRDQLDRYGEIDRAAGFLRAIAAATTRGVVVNLDDPQLSPARVAVSEGVTVTGFCAEAELDSATRLLHYDDDSIQVEFGGRVHSLSTRLRGLHGALNTVAAIALCRAVLGDDLHTAALLHAASLVGPAFGRGEMVTLGGDTLELVLVKNPGGFAMALATPAPAGCEVMIAVNDRPADGRDVSWLWDVDFGSIPDRRVDVVSGGRAAELCLRLKYDLIASEVVEPDPAKALRIFLDRNEGRPKRVYCTYTAMLAVRRELSALTVLEPVR